MSSDEQMNAFSEVKIPGKLSDHKDDRNNVSHSFKHHTAVRKMFVHVTNQEFIWLCYFHDGV